ncbi:MAG TPA: glycine cleavage system protein GcvH [Thermoanaerobaculia bacterium]|nr:glycine cleavage system protein GcvH [Thermoanaerobaculia bacterium]HUM30188.1 glycine cleavage system protein GcvH [Thermoanaerobaculia bacterium]HXK68363.1 glycine cleavage system protein GcvH [Thermoanaerobaculia bacterium]
MAERKYTTTHEWVELEDGKVRFGITTYAQEQLGDVVFVELPSDGETVSRGETMGTIESVKAVSDLYAPVSGTVVESNGELEASPELVNQDPYGKGWLVVVDPSDAGELEGLMDEASYATFVAEEKEKEH